MAGKSVNKVILIGNLGKDPEVKYTPQGTPVAKLALATNERYKDKNGEWQDRTEWHNVVLWQRLAEIAGEYLKKGGKVYIEGRLQTRSWDDKQTNQKKYMTEVVASDLVLLGGRGEGAAGIRHAAQPPAATISISARRKPNRCQRIHRPSAMRTYRSRQALASRGSRSSRLRDLEQSLITATQCPTVGLSVSDIRRRGLVAVLRDRIRRR